MFVANFFSTVASLCFNPIMEASLEFMLTKTPPLRCPPTNDVGVFDIMKVVPLAWCRTRLSRDVRCQENFVLRPVSILALQGVWIFMLMKCMSQCWNIEILFSKGWSHTASYPKNDTNSSVFCVATHIVLGSYFNLTKKYYFYWTNISSIASWQSMLMSLFV